MEAEQADDDALVIRDSNGALLADGDSVTLIKDLKIRGFGAMRLKSEFVKKG